MRWSGRGRGLCGGRRCWSLLVTIAAGLLLGMLYTATTIESLIPKKLYDLEDENDFVVDDGGVANVANPNSNGGGGGVGLASAREGHLNNDENVIVTSESDSSETHQRVSLRFNTSSTFTPNDSRNQSIANHKTILFYTKFFSSSWDGYFSQMDSMHQCPVSACTFLQDSPNPDDADALIFHAYDFNKGSLPKRRRPEQLYVWLSWEAPSWEESEGIRQLRAKFKTFGKLLEKRYEWMFGLPDYFNWTMTYHRASDVMVPYGALLPLSGEADPLRPALLDKSGPAYVSYLKALESATLLQGKREDGEDWAAFLTRPKLVAWMVSHCSTTSGREYYVRELRWHIEVDVFGACGERQCPKDHMEDCYTSVLRPTYKFYLAFENNLCEDYLTEKVWLPLIHGLVPVVYGGSRYSDFLPPHSYVDATHLRPQELASLLTSIASSPEQYGRYHLWRKYWRPKRSLPLCEICLLLHRTARSSNAGAATRRPHSQYYRDLREWWWGVSNCTTHYPWKRYPRH
ncbi:alpha-(1,3)-fucosyltransferase C-like [Eriocheir sinensis]|uniref:alpha-(1,3)-fucosyltransferase C-like n=1 Tax=Eriocheir sinensis TaxID=95602 RepID=UPI0021CA6216|nr:alpha-(1,3)-fucosyltransferase C-like [Eriocheir sinensis]